MHRVEQLFRPGAFDAGNIVLENKAFTAALIEPKISDQLQKLSDKEQEEVLKAVSEYTPAKFKERLKALGKAIPAN